MCSSIKINVNIIMCALSGLRNSVPLVQNHLLYSSDVKKGSDLKKAKTPTGRLDQKWESGRETMEPQERPVKSEEEVYAPFPKDTNPDTGEIGGPKGPEPTRYGDWERKGRVIDF